ncbi:MAG: PhnD/SsuA/transferrin family substrate-binding protein [Deltaproteobacteria bacterium]|nr:PhnD/SsuA/transferrin family substrate-binding protein [Deltaproteobacteria bacterium]
MNEPRNTIVMATKIALVALLILCTSGCNQTPQNQEPKYGTAPLSQNIRTYDFAVHPLHNPSKMNKAYQPLISYLNRLAKDVRFNLEASRDYASFEAKIRAREPAFLLPNPWQTLEAMKAGYTVIAMAGEPHDFKGIFLVRRDSGIRKPTDLKGKAVSYPSHTALAACIMPQYFLHRHGVNVNKEIDNRYVGSQESSIMNAYLKQTVAAATWPTPWRAFQKEHPTEAAEMKLMWETPSLINNSVMARNDVPLSVREQVRESLLKLHNTPEGRAILEGMETARFRPAADADYDIVRDYIAGFEKEVRPVERK